MEQKNTEMAAPRILLIEDEANMAEVLVGCFRAEGWNVTVCKDGLEAIAAMQEKVFNIIISDLVMPHSDGFDVLAALRKTLNKSTPIIMLTNVDRAHTERVMELGATLCLQKGSMPLKGIILSVKQILAEPLRI